MLWTAVSWFAVTPLSHGETIKKVGLDELIKRAVASSVELAALRGEVEVSREMVDLAMPIRDPQLRLQYNYAAGPEVPGSYTEQISETINQSRSTSARARSRPWRWRSWPSPRPAPTWSARP